MKEDFKPNYFGTDLRNYGHYFWELYKSGGIDYRRGMNMSIVPFYPYDFPKKEDGLVGFYHENGYSILAILASCKDTRPGCHSVFFVKGTCSKETMLLWLKQYDYGVKIVEEIERIYPQIKVFNP